MDIKIDQAVANRLAQKGISDTVGTYGEHKVKIGSGSPVRLDKIKGASIPYQGFRTATKITRGSAGLAQSAETTLAALRAPGNLNAGKLLAALKTNAVYLGNLDKLGELSSARKENALWALAPAVERLSNNDLAVVYQKLNSAEMTLLQTALTREGAINPKATDARSAASQLFDLQALILKEMSNRVSNSKLDDMIAQEPRATKKAELEAMRPKTLSEQYAGRAIAQVAHDKDMTATNLHSLANVVAESATRREKSASAETEKLSRRGMSATPREMGDVLRASELTINLNTAVFLSDDAFVLNANEPLQNAYHRVAKGDQSVRNASYMRQRTATENLLFPEMAGHAPIADERPIYAALNTQKAQNGASARGYGRSVVVLKPEVARRATFIAEDTFYSPKTTITPERKTMFYRLLGDSGLSTECIARLRDSQSADHQVLEAKLNKMSGSSDLTAASFRTLSNADTLGGFNIESENPNNDPEELLMAVCLKAFGDTTGTRAKMATYDNLESLLPELDDLNGALLAETAERRARGEDASIRFAMNYFEAQVQGPIVPGRDIQEIRVAVDDLDVGERGELIRRMENFHRETGVKVVYFAYDADAASALPEGSIFELCREDDDAIRAGETRDKGLAYFATHIKKDAYTAISTISPTRVQDALRFVARQLHLEDRFPATGDVLPPNGTIFRDVMSRRLPEEIDRQLQNPSFSMKSPEDVVEAAIREVFKETIRRKAAILDKLATLDMNDAQRAAFRTWIVSSKVKTPEELEMIFDNAKLQAAMFEKIATEDPPLSDEETLAGLMLLSDGVGERTDIYRAALPPDTEYGTDDKFADFSRSVSLGFSLAMNAENPLDEDKIQALQSRLNKPSLRALVGQLDAFVMTASAERTDNTVEKQGYRNLFDCNRICAEIYSQTAQKANAATRPPQFNLPISHIPLATRNLLAELSAPEFVEAMNRAYPPFAAFPAADTPLAMPMTEADRRHFLIDKLDIYLNHEKTFDPKGVHGRGHIGRAYIFATAMCNILEESGIYVDRNAVLCGIAMHDAGRQGNGADIWEADSARLTVEHMRTAFGDESMGADYEAAVQRITTDKDFNTFERMILQSADSLDIGRTKTLDLDLFPFLMPRGDDNARNYTVKNLRSGLAKEADLLQRLTNELCSRRDAMTKFEVDAMHATDPAETERLMALRDRERAFVDAAFEGDRALSSEAFFARMEHIVRANPQLFPILSKYYN